MMNNDETQNSAFNADYEIVDLETLAAQFEADTTTDEPADTAEVEAVTEAEGERESAGTCSAPSASADADDVDDTEPFNWQVTYEAACSYGRAGLNVIPVTCDGTKRPGCKWSEYQTKRANIQQLFDWFHSHSQPDSVFGTVKPAYTALGIVAGAVSFNLTIVDFDNEAYWLKFTELLPNHPELQAIVEACPLVRTPRPGRHLYVRCLEAVPKNQKLAMDITGKECYIETRGEGGFVVAPGGSPKVHQTGRPYELISGSFDIHIPRVTRVQLEALFDLCRSLSEQPIQPSEAVHQQTEQEGAGKTSPGGYDRTATTKAGTPSALSPSTTDGVLPGDAYNETNDVLAVLLQHGWTVTDTLANGDIQLKRPGKRDDGHSATYHAQGTRKLSIWSSNASPFEAGKNYSPFDVYAQLETSGDYAEAAKQLGKAGYGVKSTAKPTAKPTSKDTAKGSTQKEHAGTSSPEQPAITDDSHMGLCMRSIMAYVEPNPAVSPLKEAAETFYENHQLLDDYERECLKIQLQQKHVNPEIVLTLIGLGEPKEPVPHLTTAQILAMSFEPREELPLFGIPGAFAFIKDVAACLTAAPSAGKTELLSRSARYWKCPVMFISEEPVRTWFDRLTNMEKGNLPDNPLLEILPASGRGHSFVMDTIKSALSGTVVIVDSARDFSGVVTEADGPEWVAAIDPWIRAADKQGVTLIVLHHDKKGASGNVIDSASGSNALMSRFGQRIHLKAAGDDNQFLKVEGIARAGKVNKTYWKWQNGTIVKDDKGNEHHAKSDSVSNLLLALLDTKCPQTVAGLLNALEAKGKKTTVANVRKELNNLKTKGLAECTITGTDKTSEWIKTLQLMEVE